MYTSLKEKLISLHHTVAGEKIDHRNNGLISLYDEKSNVFAIKGSHVRGDSMNVDDILILDHEANVLSGDADRFDKRFFTHLVIYKAFPHIRSIVQLDTRWCSIWSQTTGKVVPPLSALHARYFFGEIPCTGFLDNEIHENIFADVGESVVKLFELRPVEHIRAALIRNMGGIAFGVTGEAAVETAIALEEVVARAWQTRCVVKEQYRYVPYVLTQELFV